MDENTSAQKFPFAILQHYLKQKKKKERSDTAWSTAHKTLYTPFFVAAKCPDASSTKACHIHRSQSSTVWQKHDESGLCGTSTNKLWIFFLSEGWLSPNQHGLMLVTAKKHLGTSKLWNTELKWGDHSFVHSTPETEHHPRLQLSRYGVKGSLMSKRTRPWLDASTSSTISSVKPPRCLWCPNLLCKAMADFVD